MYSHIVRTIGCILALEAALYRRRVGNFNIGIADFELVALYLPDLVHEIERVDAAISLASAIECRLGSSEMLNEMIESCRIMRTSKRAALSCEFVRSQMVQKHRG